MPLPSTSVKSFLLAAICVVAGFLPACGKADASIVDMPLQEEVLVKEPKGLNHNRLMNGYYGRDQIQ